MPWAQALVVSMHLTRIKMAAQAAKEFSRGRSPRIRSTENSF
jgi:hypothetical protein